MPARSNAGTKRFVADQEKSHHVGTDHLSQGTEPGFYNGHRTDEPDKPRRRTRAKSAGVLDNPYTAQLVADELRCWADHLERDGESLTSRVDLLRQAAAEIAPGR